MADPRDPRSIYAYMWFRRKKKKRLKRGRKSQREINDKDL